MNIIVDEQNNLVKYFVHTKLFCSYNNGVVIVVSINGTTEKIDGRYDEGNSPDQRKGLGSIQCSSQGNGGNSIRINQAHRSRENTAWTDQSTSHCVGKILKRLKIIEHEYLSYLQGHQERLETRMNESKERELAFREMVKELEQEIYNLASQNEVSEDEQE
ncbi:hypothetical protein NIES37_62710 [Tolypothrix tenuis PCC 7101]|uniref:Uncharacterized protein n=1 Tax=Tolypothrix tenuis PCC 7101 TaxID=231146 RepID=A0A1Z4N959_9CYAN|nr:hypothetical protein NIES37_62710 [Tolypothrix tenuis PCC 7101]BAZ73820.1 hypothetical protein NIES50_23860 [Aulosira laxa NIES-50]